MATFYLLNTVTVASIVFRGGDLIDDAVKDAASIRLAGGILWPSADAAVAAGAVIAQKLLAEGQDERIVDGVMHAAASSSNLLTATALAAGPVVQKVSFALTAALVAALGASTTGSIPFPNALPTNARLVGAEVVVGTKFQNSGDSATISTDVGTSAAGHSAIAAHTVDLHTTGSKGGGSTTGYSGMSISGETPQLALTSSVNLSTITAGAATVTFFYTVL